MRHAILVVGLAVSFLVPAGARAERFRERIPLQTIYRFVNGGTADHLYTTDPRELADGEAGYTYEGPAFSLAARPGPGLVPLYRFFTPDGGHFYTPSRRAGEDLDATYEGVLGYMARRPGPGVRPLYQWYNAEYDRYFYTYDRRGEAAPEAGYQNQGVIGYVFTAGR